MKKPTVVSAVCAAALGAAVYWLAKPGSEGSGPSVGTRAPDHVWTDVSGRTAALSHYEGRVVLLDFWATWCASCQEELPGLLEVYRRHRAEGFELLAPSLDEDGRKALAPYLAAHPVPWRVLLSDLDDAKAYHVFGLPTKYLIDRRGRVAKRYVGPVDPAELERDLRPLLASSRDAR
jgi:thiol-disulfide isomerase/thioredoxin